MAIIFLDIDGVLVHSKCKSYRPAHNNCFDPKCVEVLNRFCDETKAKIVVSSTWRIGRPIANLQELLEINGIKCTVIGKTPCSSHGMRGKEIATWIKEHEKECRGHSFFVIDDETYDMGNLHHEEFAQRVVMVYVKEGWFNGGLKMQHLFPGEPTAE